MIHSFLTALLLATLRPRSIKLVAWLVSVEFMSGIARLTVISVPTTISMSTRCSFSSKPKLNR